MKVTGNGGEVSPCGTAVSGMLPTFASEKSAAPAPIVADWIVTGCAQLFTATNCWLALGQN